MANTKRWEDIDHWVLLPQFVASGEKAFQVLTNHNRKLGDSNTLHDDYCTTLIGKPMALSTRTKSHLMYYKFSLKNFESTLGYCLIFVVIPWQFWARRICIQFSLWVMLRTIVECISIEQSFWKKVNSIIKKFLFFMWVLHLFNFWKRLRGVCILNIISLHLLTNFICYLITSAVGQDWFDLRKAFINGNGLFHFNILSYKMKRKTCV